MMVLCTNLDFFANGSFSTSPGDLELVLLLLAIFDGKIKVECEPGTYCKYGKKNYCEAGKYGILAGAYDEITSCSKCYTGSFQPGVGQRSCRFFRRRVPVNGNHAQFYDCRRHFFISSICEILIDWISDWAWNGFYGSNVKVLFGFGGYRILIRNITL